MIVLAYTGPGLGAGIVATVLGVIASFFIAIFATIWYPVKRLIRRIRARRPALELGTAPSPDDRP